MPPGFSFSQQEIDLWRPLRLDRENLQLGAFGINGVARIADGSTLGQVRAELEAMMARTWSRSFPTRAPRRFWRTPDSGRWSTAAREAVVGDIEATLWILLGAVGFLLLIACANVANLFLVRSEARHGEVAIRAALGESRGRLAGSVLFESLVIRGGGRPPGVAAGAAGGAAPGRASARGSCHGWTRSPSTRRCCCSDSPCRWWRGCLFGLLPALRAGAVAAAGHMTAGARGATVGPSSVNLHAVDSWWSRLRWR